MWLKLCEKHKEIEFWAYTKSVNYWVNRLNEIPSNLVLTASRGGKNDNLIEKHNLKNVEIIKKKEQANGRPIDEMDIQARIPNVNFCLIDNFAK
jgi:hypothetical protein